MRRLFGDLRLAAAQDPKRSASDRDDAWKSARGFFEKSEVLRVEATQDGRSVRPDVVVDREHNLKQLALCAAALVGR